MKRVILLLSLISVGFCQCKKKTAATETKTYTEESPLRGFLQQSGGDQYISTSIYPSGTYYANGFAFKILQKGILKAFKVKLPASDPNLIITLWDVSTADAVKSEVMNISNANTEITKSITPIQLSVGKEYIISMKAKSEFSYRRSDTKDLVYPQKVGNISVLRSFSDYKNDYMPDSISGPATNYFYGDIDFVFQQTE